MFPQREICWREAFGSLLMMMLCSHLFLFSSLIVSFVDHTHANSCGAMSDRAPHVDEKITIRKWKSLESTVFKTLHKPQRSIANKYWLWHTNEEATAIMKKKHVTTSEPQLATTTNATTKQPRQQLYFLSIFLSILDDCQRQSQYWWQTSYREKKEQTEWMSTWQLDEKENREFNTIQSMTLTVHCVCQKLWNYQTK